MAKAKSPKEDHRILRPILIREKKLNRLVTLQQTARLLVDGQEFYFYQPNVTSLFVNISNREYLKAKRIYDSLIKPNLEKKKLVTLKGAKLKRLFNYFQHIQNSVVSIYTAVESLADVAIPDEYSLELVNNKKVKEIEFNLGTPIRDHSFFKGCSGAPILDSRGQLVALVTHGDKDVNSSSLYGFRFDKVKEWIQLMYFASDRE